MRSCSGFLNSALPIAEARLSRAGERYFDDSLRGGNGIRSRFLLMIDDADARPSRRRDSSLDRLSNSLSCDCHDISLIRPDGYIAYSGHNHDGSAAALKSVRSLLQRQTN